MTQTTLQRTPLYERHAALGAKLVPFAGWEMPLQYAGILAEHRAVRDSAGLFDVSHMGEFELSGEGAVAFIDRMTTNSLAALPEGGVQYTLLLNEEGGVIDDLLLYRLPDRLLLVVNAANREADLAWLRAHGADGARLLDRSREFALLALQGPDAPRALAAIGGKGFESLGYYHVAEGSLGDIAVVVSRTGYTGEDGFEIFVPGDEAVAVWDRLLAEGVAPVGLGARDSLRLEMRFCLHGSDIDATTNPLEAGLGWVVKMEKGEFIGREALLEAKQRGLSRRLVGFVARGREIPRPGYAIYAGARRIGSVSSGGFGPAVGKGIGMGYVEREFASSGTEIEVDCRGRRATMEIIKGPFYREGSHK